MFAFQGIIFCWYGCVICLFWSVLALGQLQYIASVRNLMLYMNFSLSLFIFLCICRPTALNVPDWTCTMVSVPRKHWGFLCILFQYHRIKKWLVVLYWQLTTHSQDKMLNMIKTKCNYYIFSVSLILGSKWVMLYIKHLELEVFLWTSVL